MGRSSARRICRLVNGEVFEPSDWSEVPGLPIIRIQNLNDATKPFNYWARLIFERQVIGQRRRHCLDGQAHGYVASGTHKCGAAMAGRPEPAHRSASTWTTRIAKEWAFPAFNHQLEVLIGRAHGGVGLPR